MLHPLSHGPKTQNTKTCQPHGSSRLVMDGTRAGCWSNRSSTDRTCTRTVGYILKKKQRCCIGIVWDLVAEQLSTHGYCTDVCSSIIE